MVGLRFISNKELNFMKTMKNWPIRAKASAPPSCEMQEKVMFPVQRRQSHAERENLFSRRKIPCPDIVILSIQKADFYTPDAAASGHGWSHT